MREANLYFIDPIKYTMRGNARTQAFPIPEDEVRSIRADFRTGMSQAVIARKYNRRSQSVYQIVHRHTYKDLK